MEFERKGDYGRAIQNYQLLQRKRYFSVLALWRMCWCFDMARQYDLADEMLDAVESELRSAQRLIRKKMDGDDDGESGPVPINR